MGFFGLQYLPGSGAVLLLGERELLPLTELPLLSVIDHWWRRWPRRGSATKLLFYRPVHRWVLIPFLNYQLITNKAATDHKSESALKETEEEILIKVNFNINWIRSAEFYFPHPPPAAVIKFRKATSLRVTVHHVLS